MGRTKLRGILVFICDCLVVVLSYFFALWLRLDFKIIETNYFITLYYLTPIILVIHAMYLLLFRATTSLWEYVSINEVVRILAATILANITIWLVSIGTGFMLPNSVYVMAFVLIATGLSGIRIMYRYWRLLTKKKRRTRNCIIIGAGSGGFLLSKEIMNNNQYDYKIVGFIDDNPDKAHKSIAGYLILGNMSMLREIVERKNISIAFIAIPSASKDEIRKILEQCEKVNLAVKIMRFNEIDFESKPHIQDVSIEDLLGRGEVRLEDKEITGYIKDKTILVTGAGGSIGSELCRQIAKYNPKKMIFVDIYENTLYDLQMEFEINKRTKGKFLNIEMIFLIASVRDRDEMSRVMERNHPDVVFHAAAHKHVPLMEDSPQEAIKNNILGTFNVINACTKNGVSRFILISSDKAVHPTSVMGATKRVCELIVQSLSNNGVTTLAAVRFGNVLGSNGSVIPLFKKQIEQGGPVTVTDPEITRYFMTIPEASSLVLQAGAYASNGEVFVLDMGKSIKIVELAEKLIKLSGLQPYKDIPIEFTGLRQGEKMYEEIMFDNSQFRKTKNDLIYISAKEDIDAVKFRTEILRLIDKTNVFTPNLKEELMKCVDSNYRGKPYE